MHARHKLFDLVPVPLANPPAAVGDRATGRARAAASERDVFDYLLARRLVDARSIVDGELVIVDVSRRNRNFAVLRTDGPCFLLKLGVEPDKAATLAREAAVYRWLASRPAGNRLARYLPRYVVFDADAHVLVLEWIRGAENLREYHARSGPYRLLVAAEVGRGLAMFHGLGSRPPPGSSSGAPDQQRPWILSIDRPPHRLARDLSLANLQLIRMIQACPDFARLLARLGEDWRATTLTHGDVRWDNCVVFSAPGSSRLTRLSFVDWELATAGDPRWDVGCVFAEYLSWWVASIPILGVAPSDRFLHLARHPLERMQPPIRAFWDSYVRHRPVSEVDGDTLRGAVRCAGARLIHIAFEQTQKVADPGGGAVYLLQLGLNMLERPEEAAVMLLGLHNAL